MSSMSKIRIRMGTIEVEYEGSEEFIRTDLPNLLTSLISFHDRINEMDHSSQPDKFTQLSNKDKVSNHGTTSSIAALIGCDSGPELAIAAAARLVFSCERDEFTRQELHEEMKTAKQYYGKNIGSNLSTTLHNLVKAGKLKETATDTYSLAKSEYSRIEALLGNG